MGKTASSSPPSSRRRFLRNPSAIPTTSEPGWLMLREDPPAAALMRFSKALRRFAASLQKTSLYHETITWAYLLLINERMERAGRSKSWQDFAAANVDLLIWRPTVLEAYYLPETLGSNLARRVFVLPDRLLR